HHPDPHGERVLRTAQNRRPPAHENLSVIGPVVPVQNPHQGGLAGAVLSDDPVNGSASNDERNIPIGVNVPKRLADRAQLDHRAREARTTGSPPPGYFFAM